MDETSRPPCGLLHLVKMTVEQIAFASSHTFGRLR